MPLNKEIKPKGLGLVLLKRNIQLKTKRAFYEVTGNKKIYRKKIYAERGIIFICSLENLIYVTYSNKINKMLNKISNILTK